MLLPKEVDEKGWRLILVPNWFSNCLNTKDIKKWLKEFIFRNRTEENLLRGNYNLDEKSTFDDTGLLLKNITVFDLARAFQKIMSNLKPEPIHQSNGCGQYRRANAIYYESAY